MPAPRSKARRARALASGVALLSLTGCAGAVEVAEQPPTTAGANVASASLGSTPGSTDPRTAVLAFVAERDRLAQDSTLALARLERVARDPLLAESISVLTTYRSKQWRAEGETVVEDLIIAPGADRTQVSVTACSDVNDVMVTDGAGQSVVGEGPRRTRSSFTVALESGLWFVVDKEVFETC